jgi:8-oxo-dGTP diphosphatase
MFSPIATVAAIITRETAGTPQVLLVLRDHEPYRGYWSLPGGHIDRNETAEHAAMREVKEETNLDFTPSFVRYFDEIIPERDIHAVVIVFAGPGTGSLKPQPGEIADVAWFDFDAAQELPLAFYHNTILANYTRHQDGENRD